MFLPYSLLCSKGRKKGTAVGRASSGPVACNRASCQHALMFTVALKQAQKLQHVSVGHSLTFILPPLGLSQLAQFCPQDNYNPSAPLAFSNVRSGEALLSAFVIFHQMFLLPPCQLSLDLGTSYRGRRHNPDTHGPSERNIAP